MKILITGGTGFIGSHVRDALLDRPESQDLQIACMTRDPKGRKPSDLRVSFVAGDVRDPSSLERATEGIEVVVHCVQFPNHPVENPSKGHTYMEVDARGTLRLVAACKRNGVARIVYLSGAGVAPGRPEPWFEAKRIAEGAVSESGMQYVILRPSWVYGAGDRTLNRLVFFVRYLPFVPVIGDGTNRLQPVWISDVARVTADAVFNKEANGGVFELGGPEELTMDEILATLQRVLGTHRPLLHHPRWFMKLALIQMQLLPNPMLSPAMVDSALQEARVNTSEARRVFGIEFTPLEKALRSYLDASRR